MLTYDNIRKQSRDSEQLCWTDPLVWCAIFFLWVNWIQIGYLFMHVLTMVFWRTIWRWLWWNAPFVFTSRKSSKALRRKNALFFAKQQAHKHHNGIMLYVHVFTLLFLLCFGLREEFYVQFGNGNVFKQIDFESFFLFYYHFRINEQRK